MGSTSKDDKRNADILAEDEEVDRKLNKKVKQGELKGLLGSIIADDLKVSSRPPSPASFSLDGRKHAEIFRTDLISAMKLPDQQNLSAENYMMITDPWRQEWERGVQVPVHPEGVFQASFRPVEPVYKRAGNFKLPSKLLTSASKARGRPTSKCPYNLGRIDVEWLTCLNKTRHNKGLMELEESMLEQAIAYIENKCYDNMGHAIVTQEGLSIEYDEDVCCDVCQSPDSEELNEMVFCDSCDICVHQACYGIQNIPLGSWLCHPCRKGNKAPCCALCPHSGSAMKKAKNGKAWVHVSCALWIPEVGFGNVSKMEPVTRIENIPASRWNLVCSLCREKVGACIQCTIKSCVTAFHVTCGFKHGLEMRTVLDDSAADGVRHICYCARHSHKSKSPSKKGKEENKPASSEEAENLRQKRLKQMEEDFHKFVSVLEIAKDLNLPKELATRIHKYWTLKRKAQDDIPLLPPTLQQQEQLSGKQGSASSSNDLQAQLERVVKLRCNLEKLRNLCYMVTKREKMRRELYRAREEVFWKEHEVMTDESCDMDREEVRRVLTMCKDNFSGDGSAAAATTHDEGGEGGDSVLSYLSSRVSSTSNSPMSGLEDRSSTEQESGTESGTDDKRSSGGKTEECDEQDSKMAPSPTPSSEEDLPPRRTRRNSHLLGQPSSSVGQPSSSVGQTSSSVGQSSSSVGQSSSSVGQSSSSVEPAEPARECPKRVENTDKSEQRPRTKSLSFSEGDVVRPQRMRRSAAARDVKVHTAEKTRTRRTRHHSLPDLEEDEKEEPLPPSDEDVRMSDAMPREARTRTLRAGKVAKRPEKSESGSQQETSQKPEVDEKESLKENDPLRPEFSLVRRRSTSSSNNRNKTKATKRRRSKSSDTSTDGSTRSKQARITEFLRRKSPKSPKSGRRRGHGKSSAEESECEQVRTEIHVDHSTKGVPSPKTFSNGREVPPASSACPTCKVQHDKHSKTCLCGKESSRAAEGCEESWSRRELRLRSFQSPKSRARCSQAVSPKPHCCSSLMVKFCHATVT